MIGLGLLMASVAFEAAGCGDEGPANPEPDAAICLLDGLCDEPAGESCYNCRADCCPKCDLLLDASEAPADYLVSRVQIYTDEWCDNAPPGPDFGCAGVELDGDYLFSNEKEASLNGAWSSLAVFQEFPNPETLMNAWIADGRFLLLLRFHADDPRQDDSAVVQLLPAELTRSGTPLYDGTDVVRVPPGALRDRYLCGTLEDGFLSTAPSEWDIALPCTFCDPGAPWLPATWMRMEGVLAPSGPVTLRLGGGHTERVMREVYIPELLRVYNRLLSEDTDGDMIAAARESFDQGCYHYCDPDVPPEGACVTEDATPVVDPWEFYLCRDGWSRDLFAPALAVGPPPQVEITTFGWKITAVPVTVRP